MTGAQILDAILADSFTSSKRSQALTWANAQLGELWNLEEWTFRNSFDAVTVTANSRDVSSLPDDLGIAQAMFRANGDPLEMIPEYRDYAVRYLGTNNAAAGIPEAFWCGTDAAKVGPTSSETSSGYLLVYEKALTLLADNSTEAPIPEETHLAIVFGGKATGYLLSNADHAATLYAQRDQIVEGMRRSYLTAVRGATVQQPAYRPGWQPTYRLGR